MNEEPRDSDHIPDRQQRILQRVASGEDWRAAARAEGCSASYSRVIRTRMMKNPAVAQAIAKVRTEGRKLAAYDLAQAMKEADDAAKFAKLHKNPMANVKAVELRSRLSGLLVDKVEVVSVDLTKALAAAEARVLHAVDIAPRPFNGGLIPAVDSTYYNGPGQPGTPLGD